MATVDDLRTLVLALPGTTSADRLRQIVEQSWRSKASKSLIRSFDENRRDR